MAGAGGVVAYSSMVLAASPAVWLVSIAVLVIAGFIVASYFFPRRAEKPTPRIKIFPRETVVIGAEGTKMCGGCRSKLEAGEPRAYCELNHRHEIHADCRELVRGKCPICGGNIADFN